MSGTTSQPNLNSIVAALAHTKRDTGLDLDALNQCADYWEVVREYYAPFDTGPKSGSAEVYLHEMPGGQYTNLKEQAESMGLGARWHEIARTYAEVNLAFGDIVKVTPSSKVVGDMAIFLVNHNMTMHQFEQLHAGPQPDAALERDRHVHGLARRARRRLAEAAAEDHPEGRQAAARPSRRASAAGRSRRDRRRGGEEDRPQAAARRSAQLPDVPRRVPEVRARPARTGATSTCCPRRSSSTAWSAAARWPWNWSPARRW